MSEPLSAADLAALESLLERASPAPWVHTVGMLKHYVSSADDDLGFSLQEMHYIDGHETRAEADAALIVALRNDAPALIADVRRLREQVSQMQAAQRERARRHLERIHRAVVPEQEAIDAVMSEEDTNA